jgi:sec-independent protein translocase protein TatA
MFGGGIGWLEIILILVVVLLLFGARRIPDIMHSFGKGIREFKKGINEIQREIDSDNEKNDREE